MRPRVGKSQSHTPPPTSRKYYTPASPPLIPCRVCDEKFTRWFEVDEHMHKIHPGWAEKIVMQCVGEVEKR